MALGAGSRVVVRTDLQMRPWGETLAVMLQRAGFLLHTCGLQRLPAVVRMSVATAGRAQQRCRHVLCTTLPADGGA